MSKTTTLRRKQIEQIVATRHIVHVQALAKELLVSCETIRKDLAFLEEDRKSTRLNSSHLV